MTSPFKLTITIDTKSAAQALRALRLRCNVSQVEAAKALGVTQGTWSRVENGKLAKSFEVKRFREVFGRRK